MELAQGWPPAAGIVAEERVEGLLTWPVQTTVRERVVRGYQSRPRRVEREEEHTVEVGRDEGAIERARRELGWRVYGTNHR